MKIKRREFLYIAAFLFLSILCFLERSGYHNLSTLAKEAATWPLLFLFDLLFTVCMVMSYGGMLKKEYRILLCIALMLPSIPNFPGMGSLHLFGAYCGLIASCLITLLFLWRYQQKYLMPYIALLFLLTVLYSGEFVVTSLMEWLYLNADLLLAWYAGEKNCIFDLFSVK